MGLTIRGRDYYSDVAHTADVAQSDENSCQFAVGCEEVRMEGKGWKGLGLGAC